MVGTLLLQLSSCSTDLRFRAVGPVGAELTVAGSAHVHRIPSIVERPFSGLPYENSAPVCYLQVDHRGQTSRGRLHAWDGGFKAGFTAVLHRIESMDGGAWLHRMGADGWEVEARLPQPGHFLLTCHLWLSDEICVDGLGSESEPSYVKVLTTGRHELSTEFWSATIDATESVCVDFFEWGSQEGETLGFSYETNQFQSADVELDGEQTVSLSKLESRPSFHATEYSFRLEDGASIRCEVRIRFLRDHNPYLSVRVTRSSVPAGPDDP